VLSRAVAAALILGLTAPVAVARAGPLRAGAASVTVDLPDGVPLAGYGALPRRRLWPDLLGRHPHTFWFRPSQGTRDPITARALVLDTAATRLLWATADIVGVDAGFVTRVEERLAGAGLRYTATIVSASHTHSGPGAFVNSPLFGVLVMDRMKRAIREALIEAIVSAARGAERRLQPARAGAAVLVAPAVTASRLDLPLDRDITVLKLASPQGPPIAVLWNFAIHGTMIGPRNLRLSGDVMGVASAQIERAVGAPALFVNGAVGDVSPRWHGEDVVDDVADELARVVVAGSRQIPVGEPDGLRTARSRLALPAPFVTVRNCLGGWAPSFLRVRLGSAMPRSAELLAVALGETAWVTVPGELQTALGSAVEDAGRRHFRTAFVAGLSNGYLGYFLTPEAYRRPGYIECASLYGDEAGTLLATEAARLLESLRGYDPAVRRRASSDFLRAAVLR
jgi:hypothetical protein